ncbi:hypothetical protein [Asanoa siamensis]|uniref:Uncharacterized protein n=1 Tax=Asanoa siamensis TaxID=926357 RepID=A0ABQ4CM17_9ACTN|nr:hypothetical protein [Asanoa siamensis]GIF72023.1 hypothetical protein Asi02nite_15410 [Asanoa siamensis]
MVSLNKGCAQQLGADLLRQSFDRAWGDFAAFVEKLAEAPAVPTVTEQRSSGEKIDEILSLVRALNRPEPGGRTPRLRQTVLVDLREVDPAFDLLTFPELEKETVDSWLDELFIRFLQSRRPAYTYGETWVLVDEARGTAYYDMGRGWARRNGLRCDDRSVNDAGIPNGSVLTLKLLDADRRGS